MQLPIPLMFTNLARRRQEHLLINAPPRPLLVAVRSHADRFNNQADFCKLLIDAQDLTL